MNLAILSGGDGWHVQNLLRAAAELGHESQFLDFRTLQTGNLDGFEAVIVRTMPAGSLEHIIFRMDLLHAAEARGILVLNPPRALETCVDKYLTNVRLEQAGLPCPRTVVCQNAADAMTAFESLGRDVVVKPLFGSEGRGMARITDPEIAERIFHSLESVQSIIYVQEFLNHPGWDLRALVLGGRVIAAMKRYNNKDWRTNIARGGTAESYSLTDQEMELAIQAAEATGTLYAGVDLIHANNNIHIIEVNAAPGWRALSSISNIDIARAILLPLPQ